MKNFFSLLKFKSSIIYLILLGLSATIWFLIRVIPKPSRAQYPCMKAAAPLMSSFIIYILAICASMFSFRRFKISFQSSKYTLASLFLLLTMVSIGFILLNESKTSLANIINPVDNTFPVESNQPIGEAKGLFPGRVVWVHDSGATNENYDPGNSKKDYWYSNKNTNEQIIQSMLTESLIKYAEKDNINDAWEAIFKAFNLAHGRGDIGYTKGEKVAFKINITNRGNAGSARMDATPQLLNAILHELIDNVGVAQEDITMGDPYRDFAKQYRDMVMSKFPYIYYVAGADGYGVHQTVPTKDAVLFFAGADKSGEMHKSTLPQQFVDADYVINIPCLKTHNEGGITLIAKNHQGSYLAPGDDPAGQYAIAMHYSLPGDTRGTGKYRHTIDYMGHKDTGGKALIYIIDGIWGGDNWEGWISKFKSAPFNNDYPNSIFIGQDPVALESVGFDILFVENIEDNTKRGYPIELKVEIADMLSQCASSDFWPTDIQYDPEGDGSQIGSLGVFEHWNNATDRQYSRNLGTGEGVELIYEKLSEISLSVSTNSIEIGAAANSTNSFDIYANTNWTATCDQNWLTLSSESGSINSSITITAEENLTSEVRSALITITGLGVSDQTITIAQDFATGIPYYLSGNINIASPNPFSDYTVFKRPEYISPNTDLTIYNLKGELIQSFNFSNSEIIQWNGSNGDNRNLSNGIYLYKINDKTNNYKCTGKVILKR